MIVPSVLQASEYIFKYIIQSRRLFSLATGGQNEDEFRVCIHELFMSIRFFLSQENKGTSPVAQTQVYVLYVCLCLTLTCMNMSQFLCASMIIKCASVCVCESANLCLLAHVHHIMFSFSRTPVNAVVIGEKLPVIEFHAAGGSGVEIGIFCGSFSFSGGRSAQQGSRLH